GREDGERQGWGQGLEPTGHGPTLSTRERAAPLSSTVSRPEPRGTPFLPRQTPLQQRQSDDPPAGAVRRPSIRGRPTTPERWQPDTLQRRQSDDPPAGAVRRPFCGASSGGGAGGAPGLVPTIELCDVVDIEPRCQRHRRARCSWEGPDVRGRPQPP